MIRIRITVSRQAVYLQASDLVKKECFRSVGCILVPKTMDSAVIANSLIVANQVAHAGQL